jgi:hypothetical protein
MRRLRRPSKDPNKLAYQIVRLSTQEPPAKPPKPERSVISEYLASIGRKGGLKGGKARAEKLSPERRKEIARKAAKIRWEENKKIT